MAEEIGSVVVGLGIAGKVRVRDLKLKTLGLTLKGAVSRRPIQLEDVKSLSFDEALSQEDVKAILICTEPQFHEDYVRRSLQAGKHVLVEYPLALSSAVAKELYQLAEEKGLVLHEENIGLLTTSFLTVKAKAEKAKLKSANFKLSGAFNGWLENFEQSGKPFVTGVANLQGMLTLFGDLSVAGGTLEKKENGYTAVASLQTTYGSPITMTMERQENPPASRRKQAVYEFEDGETIDIEKLPSDGKQNLFMQDMEKFHANILQGGVPDCQKNLTVKSLELAEKIHTFF